MVTRRTRACRVTRVTRRRGSPRGLGATHDGLESHNRRGAHTADRTPVCVAFSNDEGGSWSNEHRLDPSVDDTGDGRSFSYPGAHFIGDQGIVTYYENSDRQISLVVRRFELATS